MGRKAAVPLTKEGIGSAQVTHHQLVPESWPPDVPSPGHFEKQLIRFSHQPSVTEFWENCFTGEEHGWNQKLWIQVCNWLVGKS